MVNRRIRWLNYSIRWINLFRDWWTVYHGNTWWPFLIPIPTKKPRRSRRRYSRLIYCGSCCSWCVFCHCSSFSSSFRIDSSCNWFFRCFTFKTFLRSCVFVELSTEIFMVITTVLETRFQINDVDQESLTNTNWKAI